MIFSLPVLFASSGAYYAYEQSDAVGKFIVIFLLLGSVLTWTIMLDKGLSLHRARKLSENFTALFRQKKSVTSLVREAQNDPGPIAQIYSAGVSQLLEFYMQGTSVAGESDLFSGGRPPQIRRLTIAQQEAIRTVLEREVSNQILKLEERIGLLGTAVSASPFFGLFGTVWGVMLAFCGVAIEGHVVISALAPGVSGALLTTVVGLIVAIPSLIGYNILNNTIRKVTIYMDNFVEAFMTQIKLEQLTVAEDEPEPATPARPEPRPATPVPAVVPAAQIPANVPPAAPAPAVSPLTYAASPVQAAPVYATPTTGAATPAAAYTAAPSAPPTPVVGESVRPEMTPPQTPAMVSSAAAFVNYNTAAPASRPTIERPATAAPIPANVPNYNAAMPAAVAPVSPTPTNRPAIPAAQIPANVPNYTAAASMPSTPVSSAVPAAPAPQPAAQIPSNVPNYPNASAAPAAAPANRPAGNPYYRPNTSSAVPAPAARPANPYYRPAGTATPAPSSPFRPTPMPGQPAAGGDGAGVAPEAAEAEKTWRNPNYNDDGTPVANNGWQQFVGDDQPPRE